MTTSNLLALAASVGLAALCHGQNPLSFQQTASNKSTDTHTTNHMKPQSPFGKEIPHTDTLNERVESSFGDFDLNDNRLTDQFIGYLSTDLEELESAREYASLMVKMTQLLAHDQKIQTRDRLLLLYQLLGKASKYSNDGGISDAFRNEVATVLKGKKSNSNTKTKINEMRKEHERLTIQHPWLNAARASLNKAERARIQANINASTAKIGLTDTYMKSRFQVLLMQLFAQRKYQHCIIGCRLYGFLFEDGEGKLKVKEGSDLAKVFTDTLGVEPTIGGLDSICNDTVLKVKNLIKYSKGHIKKDHLDRGSKRLGEAYFLGEHLPMIHLVKSQLRQEIYDYILEGKNLKDAIQSKDWIEAEKRVHSMMKISPDFRANQILTAIKAHKTASDLKINQYYMAAARNDNGSAERHIEEAIKLWPTNPKLATEQLRTYNSIVANFDNAETLESKATEFRNRAKHNDYDTMTVEDAGVFKQWFGNAKSNPKLVPSQQEEYKKLYAQSLEVMDRLVALETSLAIAEKLSDENAHNAAWEAMALEYDNNPISKKRVVEKMNVLAGPANQFINLINEAKEHKNNANYGSSLSCYLKAKTMFRKSILVERGMTELIAVRSNQ